MANYFNSTFRIKQGQRKLRGPSKPLKRSVLRRKTPLKTRPSDAKRTKGLPAWVKAIPESQSHGSGTLQKRLWRLVSDFVRIRDWYRFDGRCVATGAKIRHWSEGDAGHWKSYSVCRGMFKFAPINVHLQSKSSNGWGGQEIGHQFGEELKRRYTPFYLDTINERNKITLLKFFTNDLIEAMEDMLARMEEEKEKPDYYPRVIALRRELEVL